MRFSPPKTKKAQCFFLGLVNYCCQWILTFMSMDPDIMTIFYAQHVLRMLLREGTPFQHSNCFCVLLQHWDCLIIVFHFIFISLKWQAQEHGGGYRLVAYLSSTFDTVVCVMPVLQASYDNVRC